MLGEYNLLLLITSQRIPVPSLKFERWSPIARRGSTLGPGGPGPQFVAGPRFLKVFRYFVTDIVFVMTVCNFCICFRMRMINSRLI